MYKRYRIFWECVGKEEIPLQAFSTKGDPEDKSAEDGKLKGLDNGKHY